MLHFQRGMTIAKAITFEMEKSCHTISDNKFLTISDLTKCLRKNVGPSIEVMQALEDVEGSYPRNRKDAFKIKAKHFASDLLIPYGVMFADIAFDVMLVYGYWYQFLHTENYTEEPTTFVNGCNVTSSHENDTVSAEDVEFQTIPQKLGVKPRLFYSIAFLIIPWMFYVVEFCHSRHFNDLIRTV